MLMWEHDEDMMEKGRAEERAKTELERQRAEEEKARADAAEAELAELKKRLAELEKENNSDSEGLDE